MDAGKLSRDHRSFERKRIMRHQANDISAKRKLNQIETLDDSERIHLESLIPADYQRCHPGETLEDLKRWARFSKEDKGLLRHWMALAAEQSSAGRKENDSLTSTLRRDEGFAVAWNNTI
jgi:hypothetical protein